MRRYGLAEPLTEEQQQKRFHRTRAYIEFGKGRHPAALNFGDCMTYAVARLARESLLCVGEDFPQTDLVFDGPIGSWPEIV